MKYIELSQNKQAIVDDEDYEWLSQWKWCYGKGYARRKTSNPGGKRDLINMHRLLNNTPAGFDTDHINGDKLDNRRSNLRTLTHQQNCWNRGKNPKNNKSGYKGVSWHKAANKWVAQIMVNGNKIIIGRYSDILDASRAYNEAAIEYHGEFARINK